MLKLIFISVLLHTMQNKCKNNWLVVINPTAGKGEESVFQSILDNLSKHGINYSFRYSEARLGVTTIVKQSIEEGYKNIIAVGGDGTNNEAINGIFKQKVTPTEEITYALIPVGTGNDWIKQFNCSKNHDYIASIIRGKTRLLDTGKIFNNNLNHYFINVAGFAFDGQIAKDLDAQDNTSPLRYIKQIFKSLFSYKPHNANIVTPQKTITEDVYTVNIGLGKYSGNGMQFVPHGGQNNGKFGVTVVKSMSPYRVIASLPYIYNGKIAKHRKVTCFESSSIEITHNHSEQGIPCEVDGEFLGYTPFTISILPKSLKIIVP